MRKKPPSATSGRWSATTAGFPSNYGGIERVVVDPDEATRTWHFPSSEEAPDGAALVERVHWQIPEVGYASIVVEPNAFQITNDLSIVTVSDKGDGTVLEWRQHYDNPQLAFSVQNVHTGFQDIGARLVDRFGGEIVECWHVEVPAD